MCVCVGCMLEPLVLVETPFLDPELAGTMEGLRGGCLWGHFVRIRYWFKLASHGPRSAETKDTDKTTRKKSLFPKAGGQRLMRIPPRPLGL